MLQLCAVLLLLFNLISELESLIQEREYHASLITILKVQLAIGTPSQGTQRCTAV